VQVKSKKELKEELSVAEKELEELEKKEAEMLKNANRVFQSNEKKGKKKGDEVEVVVIRDEPNSKSLSTSQMAKKVLDAENKVRQIEAEIAARKKKGKK
jgi:hypothetical protein